MHNVPIIETVANWGLYPKANCTVYKPNSIEELMDIVQNNTDIIAGVTGDVMVMLHWLVQLYLQSP